MLVQSTDPARHNAYEELKLRGRRYYAEGQWDLALVTYTEAIEAVFAFGGDVQVLSTILSNRSAAHAQVGRWQNSLEDAEQALLMHPGNVKAYYRKGVALLQLQRAAEAVAALRLGILLAPKSKQLTKCLEKAENCTRNGFQLEREADTDTARKFRSQEVQSRQQGEAAVWTAGQQSIYHGDAPGSASQRHTPHPGWYRGTCETGASKEVADIAPDSTQLQACLGILKVEADASPATIRHAFLKRAVKEHPDKGGSAEAFAKVHAAYRALCMRTPP